MIKPKFKVSLIAFCLICLPNKLGAWGFMAHQCINRCAVFTLPSAMFTFYKYYLGYLTESAVNPDKRRYVVEGEAANHYIDIDYYESEADSLPKRWQDALQRYPEDTLRLHGILPWHICYMKGALTAAFRSRSAEQILRLSADIGHYIADANVPLHTSQNYNGQFTDQEGIHGLWETRLPELFKDQYDLLVGMASYIKDPQQSAWEAVRIAHKEVGNVLKLERILSKNFPSMQKFSFEVRGTSLKRVYSAAYTTAYHTALNGQVERQMRAAIKMVGDFWYTCWVDAERPILDNLLQPTLTEEQLAETFPEHIHLSIRDCGE
jgi:hypothetical protein